MSVPLTALLIIYEPEYTRRAGILVRELHNGHILKIIYFYRIR